MENLPDTLLLVLVQFFLLVGLFGLILPIFPGIFVMWLAALGYGVVHGFSTLGIIIFIVITALMIAGVTVDNVMMGVGARQGGASWKTIAVAMVAGVIVTFIIPPFGGIIAAPLAILLLEYYRLRDWKLAWLALRGMTVGWGLSFLVRFVIGLLMMAFWWVWVFSG
jgi:hypothetical protein